MSQETQEGAGCEGGEGTVVATFGEDITMRQLARDRFSVTYGASGYTDLTYTQAALEFGACVMHHQACAGVLDNREPGDP